MNRDERLAAYKSVTSEEAELIEPGCTQHTLGFFPDSEGKVWACHSRLGLRWRFPTMDQAFGDSAVQRAYRTD